MLLKGLYDTKVDRMKTDKYTSYMFHTFGISIVPDMASLEICGFIIKHSWFSIYLPKLTDAGEIVGLKYEVCDYVGQYMGIVETKLKIKQLLKEQPERFLQMAQAMQSMKGR